MKSEWTDYANPTILKCVSSKDPTKSRITASGPNKRSGHRVFTTEDYLYVVGGFNSSNSVSTGSSTFKDMWMLNLLTRQWKPVKLIGSFDDHMASFSLSYVPELNKFYVYGGTGFPFAENVSSSLYECTLVTEDICRIEKLTIEGNAPRLYGQSVVHHKNYNGVLSLYIIGGTEGYQYNMKIYEFEIYKKKVTFKELGRLGEAEGRYRHESVLHNDVIYSIGGSNDQVFFPCNAITGFNLKDNTFFLKQTQPDENGEFPETRKGHALVKCGDIVYMFGGMNTPENIFRDLWSLDLKTFCWKKLKNLPASVFFHHGAITQNGQILSYGGCISSRPDTIRTKEVYTFFVNSPSLLWLTTRRVYELKAQMYENSTDVFQFSYPIALINQTDQNTKEVEDDNDDQPLTEDSNSAA